MGTVIIKVKVSVECEDLIGSLPRDGGWELISEDYGSGRIVVDFDSDDLGAPAERALDTNDAVISYSVIDTPERRLDNHGFPVDMGDELLERYGND